MGALRRTYRLTQPPKVGLVDVDRTNPLARGLIQADACLGMYDSAVRVGSTATGTVIQRPDGLEFSSASSGISRLARESEKTNSFTVAVKLRMVGTSSPNAAIIGLMYDTAGNPPYGDQIDLNAGGNDLRFAFNVAGNALAINSGGVVPSSTDDSMIIATFISGRQELYLNGLLIASGNNSGSPSYTATSVIGLGNMLGDGRTANCLIKFGARWDRVLSAGEMASVQANPWQLFQSPQSIQRRLWPMAIVAGGTITGTGASTEGSDTGNGTGALTFATVTGTGASAEGKDASTGSGTVAYPAITGAGAVVEAKDTSTGTGAVSYPAITGAGAANEGADKGSAMGSVAGGIMGAGAATEGSDTGAALGALTFPTIIGTGASVEDGDTGAGYSSAPIAPGVNLYTTLRADAVNLPANLAKPVNLSTELKPIVVNMYSTMREPSINLKSRLGAPVNITGKLL